MNNTIDFNTAKTIGTMSKKIDHIDDTVSSFFSFMHMVIGSMANAFIRRLSVFWPKHGKATLIRFDPRYCKALSVSSLCTITNTTRCG